MVIVKNSVRSHARAHSPLPRALPRRSRSPARARACSLAVPAHGSRPLLGPPNPSMRSRWVPTCNDRIPSRSHAWRVARAWTVSAAATCRGIRVSFRHSLVWRMVLHRILHVFCSASESCRRRLVRSHCFGSRRIGAQVVTALDPARFEVGPIPAPAPSHTETTRACALTRTIHTRIRLAHAHV